VRLDVSLPLTQVHDFLEASCLRPPGVVAKSGLILFFFFVLCAPSPKVHKV